MGIISTVRTDCKDCYKCVRNCPSKAIRISSGHAEVIEEMCILDGRCIEVCPQQAKKVQNDLPVLKKWLKERQTIIASLAPSFPAFLGIEASRVVALLEHLGFSCVQETAVAADYVALKHAELSKEIRPLITSACPVVVNLIRKQYPRFQSYLAPILSPMAAHGKMLKQQFPGARVVFIGPCVAKKGEAYQDHPDCVDLVLTFDELKQLIKERGIEDFESIRAHGSYFWEKVPEKARLFPLGGGLLKAAGESTDLLAEKHLTLTGLETVMEFLESFEPDCDLRLIELLACSGGCIGGVGGRNVASGCNLSLFERRRKVFQFADNDRHRGRADQFEKYGELLVTERESGAVELPEPSEEEIREILARIGKKTPEDELNCGSCGYNSCREKAIAVYRGMAEVEMCMPYMRKLAESKANLILKYTPSAIIVTDNDLKIVELNPGAEKMFGFTAGQLQGRKVSLVTDPEDFARAIAEGRLISGRKKLRNLIVRQYIFYVEEHGLVIGIFYDITREEENKEQLDRVREETLSRAQQVIDKQMRVAQEIAELLGETTAETKVTLTRLMELMNSGVDAREDDS